MYYTLQKTGVSVAKIFATKTQNFATVELRWRNYFATLFVGVGLAGEAFGGKITFRHRILSLVANCLATTSIEFRHQKSYN